MGLFQNKEVVLNSGIVSDFKIECDVLTDSDLECLAYLISKRVKFRKVFGVPNGGLLLCDKLQQYCNRLANDLPILICDDVLTTGSSMEKFKELLEEKDAIGVVIFARSKPADWIKPLFQLWGHTDFMEEFPVTSLPPLEDKIQSLSIELKFRDSIISNLEESNAFLLKCKDEWSAHAIRLRTQVDALQNVCRIAGVPDVIIEKPQMMAGKKPTDKDIEWARECIRKSEN